jgi:hypothetical protein
MAKPQPHVVVAPHPSLGHVNPALQLAQMLHHHGVFVTFVSTEHNHRRSALAADGLSSRRDGPPSFRFETIPDGLLDADRGGSTPLEHDRALSQATSERGAAPLRELVARLRDGSKPAGRAARDVRDPDGADELRAGRGAGAPSPEHGALGMRRRVALVPDEAP